MSTLREIDMVMDVAKFMYFVWLPRSRSIQVELGRVEQAANLSNQSAALCR